MNKHLTIAGIIFVLFTVFFNSAVISQNILSTTVFGGAVNADGNGIKYATIQFLNKTDSITKYGTITKESGLFTLDSVVAGNYLIKVSCVGFKTKFRTVKLEHIEKETYLKVFTLQIDTLQLESIKITGKAKGYYEFANKTVFYPDSISLKSSRNTLELLNRLPEIQVNKQTGSISVLGNGNVLVLINGIDNKRMLKAISPKDIEKIELITHPSAKYRSDITSVVNIVLKDKRKQGFSVFSDLSISLNQKNHFGIFQVAYSLKKWHFFVNYNAMLYRALTNDTINRFENSNGGYFHYLSVPLEKTDFNSSMHRIQFGTDFIPDKKTILSFTGRTNISNFSLCSKQKTIYDIVGQNGLSKNGINSKNNSLQQNYSLFLKRDLTKNNSLSWNTNVYFLSNVDNSFITDTSVYPNPANQKYAARIETSNYHQFSINSRLNYEHHITESTKIEAGYQFYSRNINSNIHSENISNLLKYYDSRNSFYGNFVSDYKKFGFQTGLRFETFNINIYDTIKSNNYRLLPSFSIIFKPEHHHTFRLSYNKRLKYPSVYYLNPYEIYNPDSLSYSSGNPNLLPQTTHIIEVKYTYKRKNINLSLSMEYNYLNDIITKEYLIENGVIYAKYKNIGQSNRYGFNINLYTVLFNFIEMESYMYLKYDNFMNNSDHDGFGYKGGISTYMNLFWDIDFDFTFLFGTKTIYYTGYEKDNFLIDEISLSKDIFNGQGSIGISIWEPFFRDINYEKIWTTEFTEETVSETLNNTVFLIELTYNIEKGRKIKKIKKDLLMENNSRNLKK